MDSYSVYSKDKSLLECKDIKPVNPKGNQFWIFIGGTDAEAPTLCPADAKKQFIRKDPDAGKNWRQEEKRTTEDKMVGWNHWLNGHEFEQALGVGEEQGSLACCGPWGHSCGTWLGDWTATRTRTRAEFVLTMCQAGSVFHGSSNHQHLSR